MAWAYVELLDHIASNRNRHKKQRFEAMKGGKGGPLEEQYCNHQET
jgi:hypothetical protein